MQTRLFSVLVVPVSIIIALVWLTLIWAPAFGWIGKRIGWLRTYDDYSFGSPIDYRFDNSYTDSGFDYLTSRQSPDVQKVIKPLIAELRSKSYDDLIILKSEANPCELSDLIDCRSIDGTIVKQYVEGAFGQRQFLEMAALTRSYNHITAVIAVLSLGSLIVSIVALYYSRRLTLK
jgi:hypothetical protein